MIASTYARLAGMIGLLICCLGCNSRQNRRVLLRTNMGDIHIRLFDSTPRHRDYLMQLTEESQPNVFYFRCIERDRTIQFGPEPPGTAHTANFPEPEPGEPLLTGTLAATEGAYFFIVLGREQNNKTLEEIERQAAVRFTPQERLKYIQQGGLPEFQGRYTALGEITTGLAVAHKIAALPRNADGRPLQPVWVRLEKAPEN